jgi:hypothetical protein
MIENWIGDTLKKFQEINFGINYFEVVCIDQKNTFFRHISSTTNEKLVKSNLPCRQS